MIESSATFQQVLNSAIGQLSAAGIETAARDARILMAYVDDCDVGRISMRLYDEIDWTDAQTMRFNHSISERCKAKPVAKIIGRKAFWNHDFIVNEHVLDPRPDTETLIAAALDAPFERLLDIGTGSGAIAVTLLDERPNTTGVATDISQDALNVAETNAKAQNVSRRLSFLCTDMFKAVTGSFDLIVSNPPYLAVEEMEEVAKDTLFDPRISLTDEADGLTFYRQIAIQSPNYLAPNGRAIVEIGPTQGPAVREMFVNAGFTNVAILPDLDGRDRVVAAKDHQNRQ